MIMDIFALVLFQLNYQIRFKTILKLLEIKLLASVVIMLHLILMAQLLKIMIFQAEMILTELYSD
jgi:hypothetical protein